MAGVRLERRESIAWIYIDRPEARNALNHAAMAELDAALAEVAAWPVHAVFIRGGGDRAFIAGGDIKELESIREEDFALRMAQRMRSTLDRIPALPMPVVAALNGHAIGGGAEVAIACDLRVAADDVRIGFTQSRLGMMPAWGGVERLVGAIGRGPALLLLATGREVGAGEAERIGLLQAVYPRADFESCLEALAAEFAAVPRHALAGIKRAAEAAVPSARPDLAAAATADFARAWVHPDHWAAMDRAANRRKR